MTEEEKTDHVFVCGQDNVLSTIMGMDMGFYSWDVIVEKFEDNIIFFDTKNVTDYLDANNKDNMLDL